MRYSIIIILAFVFFFSCEKKVKTTPAPDVEKFFQVYTTFLELSRSDSLIVMDKSVLMDSAIALHKMDPAAFDSTLSYFEKRPDVFLEAFEKFDADIRTKQPSSN